MSLDKTYYVDPSSNNSNIELGTISFPFKAMDDPFREIFKYAVALDTNFTIRLMHGSNLTIFTLAMPLVALNTLVTLEYVFIVLNSFF